MIVGIYAQVPTKNKEQKPECTIPRTNNSMEIFFQDMGNKEYSDIVFCSGDMGAVFEKYGKPFQKDGMTGSSRT